MDLNNFEIIGLAFVSGFIAKNALEETEEPKEGKHSKTEDKIEKVEIQKITPKEMGEILDNLKNKIVGEEK